MSKAFTRPAATLEKNMESTSVTSYSRIHTALLNMSGYQGRVDGGVGFSISSPSWEITLYSDLSVYKASKLESEHEESVQRLKSLLIRDYGLSDFSYLIEGGVGNHVGLGSKTSLLMGFGKAVGKLFKIKMPPRDVAIAAGRGGTSGIGYWASQLGGFIWDAGRSFPQEKSTFRPSSSSVCPPPPLILASPVDDYQICHFRFSNKKIFGSKECKIFEDHCPTTHGETKELLSIVSGLLVPSLISMNDAGVQHALKTIQSLGLKAVEWRLQDNETKRFRKYWESNCRDTALCLSSMGPTMYCLTKKPSVIQELVTKYAESPIHFETANIFNGVKE